jgi:DNA-binding NtrC family response regulator
MTRVIVVQRDPAVGARIAADLRGAGYEIEQCDGPGHAPCPVIGGLPCPLVDRADVLLYDAWAAGDSAGGRRLVAELRDVYADLPVILTSADRSLDWVDEEGPNRVTAFEGHPTGEVLVAAVEQALADQGLAV